MYLSNDEMGSPNVLAYKLALDTFRIGQNPTLDARYLFDVWPFLLETST